MIGCMKRFLSRFAPLLILLVIGVQLAVTVWWLAKYRFLFASAILSWSFDFGAKIRDAGWYGFVESVKLSSYYPPAYEALGGMLHLYRDFSRTNMAILNSIFLAMASLSIYSIWRKISGSFPGVVAALLFLFIPGVFIFARVPSREIALMGAITFSAAALIHSNRFLVRRYAILFALAFALGMLIKWTFIGFFFFPVVWFFFDAIRTGLREKVSGSFLGLEKVQWVNIILAGVLIFAALAPWYLGVLDLNYLSQTTGNDPTESDGLLDMFGFYLGVLAHYARIPLFGLAMLALIIAGQFGEHRKSLRLILVWFISGYLVFTFIPHKESRNIFPLIPAMCILAVSGLDVLKKEWIKIAAAAVIVLGGGWLFAYYTFAHPVLPTDAGDLFYFERDECSDVTDRTLEKLIQTILADLPDRAHHEQNEPVRLATHPFNHDTLFWGDDQIGFRLRVRDFNQERPSIAMVGYGPTDYDRFYFELNNIEFLLASERLFTLSKELMDENIKSWKNFVTPNKKNENLPMNDPGFLKAIGERFDLVDTLSGPCMERVRLYKARKGTP